MFENPLIEEWMWWFSVGAMLAGMWLGFLLGRWWAWDKRETEYMHLEGPDQNED